MWDELKERFSHGNGPKVFKLQKAILGLFQVDHTINAYYTKLKAYWDDLLVKYKALPNCTCGTLKTLVDYQKQ